MGALTLWDEPAALTDAQLLSTRHYLGALGRAKATYRDDNGLLIFVQPSSRNLPTDWLELARWCIVGPKNAGSQQWAACQRFLQERFPEATTVVSYSDPSVGHTGALYRACNWLWAPTWHILRPPPTGGGSWGTDRPRSPKHRWVFLLHPDERREAVLAIKEPGLLRRFPGVSYREPVWHGRHHGSGGGDYHRFAMEAR